MRRMLLVPLAALLVLVAASAAFAVGRATGIGQIFGGRMIRAEVVERDGSVFDLYRGRILAVGSASITVREADGRSDTIPLAPSTRVTGRTVRLGLRRGLYVTVVRRSGGPALVVQVGVVS
jgi:hypothetical protein